MLLASDVPSSPRPRPPARARRAFSAQYPKGQQLPPPPTYDFATSDALDSLDLSRTYTRSLLASPESLTRQLMDVADPEASNWLSDRSRDELSVILLKAREVIEQRDRELGITSSVCKSLLEHNVVLKSKHDALLVRLPSLSGDRSSSQSSPSAATSPHLIDEHVEFDSTLFRQTHNRRMSTSQDDIALLSDQNAELLSKLERLEAESTAADKAGKRRLRQLEKEILGLRDELHRGHAWVEEKIKKTSGSDKTTGFLETVAEAEEQEREVQRRKREREVKVRRLRAKARPWEVEDAEDDSREGPVNDFAPGSSLFNGSSSSKHTTPRLAPLGAFTTPPRSISPIKFPSNYSTPVREADDPQPSSSRTPSPSPQPQSLRSRTKSEYAIVSQLMLKIRELEETNEELTEKHYNTLHRLVAAKKEADDISKVWEELGDEAGVQLEMVVDSDGGGDENRAIGPGVVAPSRTIRFRSVKRRKDRDSEITTGLQQSIVVHEDQRSNLESTGRTGINGSSQLDTGADSSLYGQQGKVRKPLAGLFIVPSSEYNLTSDHGGLDSAAKPVSVPISSIPSASPSGLDVFSPSIHSGGALRTLGSELATEDIGMLAAPGTHHRIRTSSLYDLARMLEAEVEVPSNPVGSDRIGLATTMTTEPDLPNLSVVPDSATTSDNIDAIDTEAQERTKSCSNESTCALAKPVEDATVAQRGTGIIPLVLELWLWLQFAIIIFVFVWTMAKRGPQSVLGDGRAERRRSRQL